MASLGFPERRGRGVTSATWGNRAPQEMMVPKERRDPRGPLARLGSQAPEV